MLKTLFLCCVSLLYICSEISAQSSWTDWEEHIDDDESLLSWQERYSELSELAEHPININRATKKELEQLPFLSDKLIENILYYVYKYGPLVSKNELLGVEGIDKQTRRFLQDFIYVGEPYNESDRLRIKDMLKYNKQWLLTRVDVPLNMKAGYAGYPKSVLLDNPNKQYLGDPVYTNLRYRFQYKNKVSFGLTAEKDSGEPFFSSINKKGYDFYSMHLALSDLGKIKTLVAGDYKGSFGYGLVFNYGSFSMGNTTLLSNSGRMGKGFSKYTSMGESEFLRGLGISYCLNRRWNVSLGYSFRKKDAKIDGMFITSLKTDGYHRLEKDVEKKNKIHNHLIVSNLFYNGKNIEYGLTAVYSIFNKVLNPEQRPYNLFYPRGRNFFNIGGFYKFFLKRFCFSGETAFDKKGHIATLNILSYSPDVNNKIVLINRYYDKQYQSLCNNPFGENSLIQNEIGMYIGLESNALKNIKLIGYLDFFHFPFRKYRVDSNGTNGLGGLVQIGYSPHNSLDMLIKYSYKNKARNYTSEQGTKAVLPEIRQRVQFQLSYQPINALLLKTSVQYLQTAYLKRKPSRGFGLNGSVRVNIDKIPLQASLTSGYFRTDDFNSRVYMNEPGLSYAFSMFSFYGNGIRNAVNLRYDYKDRLMIQAKLGWTHYTDRNRIGSGTEEIIGSNKSDVQIQLKLKW
ncbi:helix-hairpin-helix domain-containing protein [uncultured Bacteroides sp.]|uniref:helix-hairpin-helix domain-containing protein n=1 Tax=uncultured Bacteroides sp. TaxID=162156 RepID=UPI00262919CF|nr:helix-hairpin-helix domain-containing protein [uncultured Bacteroides sp.]